jgi:hypothetical protein
MSSRIFRLSDLTMMFPLDCQALSRPLLLRQSLWLVSILSLIVAATQNRHVIHSALQPNTQPSQTELLEMSKRAMQVVRLLEEYRRANFPEVERVKMDTAVAMTPPDDHRPPKRPWEDLSQDGNTAGAETAVPEVSAPVSLSSLLYLELP